MFACFQFPEFPTPLTRSWRSILIILIARCVHAHLRERPTSWCGKYHGEAYRELHDSRSTWLASDRFSLALIQQGLPFQRVAHQINTTDVQPTVGSCFTILVTGLLAVRLPSMHTRSTTNEPFDSYILRSTKETNRSPLPNYLLLRPPRIPRPRKPKPFSCASPTQ